jgi:hypothetical protein
MARSRSGAFGWTVTLVVGLGLVGLAGFLGVREHVWIKQAALTNGVVVELVAHEGRSGRTRSTTYRPRVTFTSEDGREHTFTRSSGSNPPGYTVGEVVKVAYDRRNYEGRILSFGERFGVSVFLAAIGLGAVMTSITFTIGKRVFKRTYLR